MKSLTRSVTRSPRLSSGKPSLSVCRLGILLVSQKQVSGFLGTLSMWKFNFRAQVPVRRLPSSSQCWHSSPSSRRSPTTTDISARIHSSSRLRVNWRSRLSQRRRSSRVSWASPVCQLSEVYVSPQFRRAYIPSDARSLSVRSKSSNSTCAQAPK